MGAFLFGLVAAAFAAKPQVAVTPQELAAYVLSHDLLEGRALGSRGSQVARVYLASLLASWGYEGAGDGGNFPQELPMVGIDTLAPKTWGFSHGQ